MAVALGPTVAAGLSLGLAAALVDGAALAFELPLGRRHIGGDETKEILLALPALDGDVDVVMSIRIIGSRTAGPARQIYSFDTDQHVRVPVMALGPIKGPATRSGPPSSTAPGPGGR